MASFTSAIIQGIQQHLAADSTLRALLGATVDAPKIMYGGFEGSPVPCVTFIIVGNDNKPYFDSDATFNGSFQFDSWVTRRAGIVGAMEIAERVHQLLNRVDVAAAGCSLQVQIDGDCIPSVEEDVCRCMQEFEFFAS